MGVRPAALGALAAAFLSGAVAHAEPRLCGIVVAPDARRAIFVLDGSPVSVAAEEGEVVGPWTIVAISDRGVEVQTGRGRSVLTLVASAGVPPPPPPEPSAPVSGDAMFGVTATR